MDCAQALQNPRPSHPGIRSVLVVAAVLMDGDGRVLIAQRPQGKSLAGLWEFPGGKVKDGETLEFALMRELEEELGIETRPTCYYPLTFVTHAYPDFYLVMPTFICRTWRCDPQPREHAALQWVRPAKLGDYPMPPADGPIIAALQDRV